MKKLKEKLELLHKKPYGHYKRIYGQYDFGDFSLSIDHVQGDPFAKASLFCIAIPFELTRFPKDWLENPNGQIPLGDFITRLLWEEFQKVEPIKSSGNGGKFFVPKPGQQIIPRSSVGFTSEKLLLRFRMGLPADGRRILAKEAKHLLVNVIPGIVNHTGFLQPSFEKDLGEHVSLYQQQEELRDQIVSKGYIGFIPNGAKLPRKTGDSHLPDTNENVVPFQSTPEMEKSFSHSGGSITGMAIPKGVHLIAGGGFHGKSTLLEALQFGIYNHVKGDGREFVCVPRETQKIRAENGRIINNVDISPFINNLPGKADTKSFFSPNASGSTSQVASIVESIQAGATVLLMDEDTCANNFMIRDDKMRELIKDDEEPITPYIQRVQSIFEEYGVSTVLVLGGSGDYFSAAKNVIAMKEFKPFDVTAKAKEIADSSGFKIKTEKIKIEKGGRKIGPLKKPDRIKIKHMGKFMLNVGDYKVNIDSMEQLVCEEQVISLGCILYEVIKSGGNQKISNLHQLVDEQMKDKFSKLSYQRDGLAGVRYLDAVSVINRCSDLNIEGEIGG